MGRCMISAIAKVIIHFGSERLVFFEQLCQTRYSSDSACNTFNYVTMIYISQTNFQLSRADTIASKTQCSPSLENFASGNRVTHAHESTWCPIRLYLRSS